MKKFIFISIFLTASFTCFFFSVSRAEAATLYFNGGADSDWNTRIGNWWTDAGFTSQAPSLPAVGDDVVVSQPVTSNSGSSVSIHSLQVYGEAYNQIPITVATNATFYNNSSNSSVITGNTIFYDSSNTGGTVNGDAQFNDAGANYGTVSGDAIFNDSGDNEN